MQLREYLWPSMGMRAMIKWTRLRLLRQASQPHKVALGVAVGVWATFFPILGTHMVLSIVVCWLLGGSVLAAFTGNWLGNPWTYPLIWWSSHKVGVWVLGLNLVTRDTVHEVDPVRLWQHLESIFMRVVWPMFVGGQVIGIPVAAVFYAGIYFALVEWNAAKKRAKARA